MASVVKVYGPAMSVGTARVLLLLEEVGAEYELVNVDFATLQQKTSAHLARNPFGKVPALEDGDLVLFESRAIGRYVSRKFKSSSGVDLLREGDLRESALVNVWSEVEAQQYDPAIGPIFFQTLARPLLCGGSPDEAVVVASLERLGAVLDVYEARLGEAEYLAGDFVSFADICHVPYTHYVIAHVARAAALFEARPRVKAWWERLAARPAYRKVATAMVPPPPKKRGD